MVKKERENLLNKNAQLMEDFHNLEKSQTAEWSKVEHRIEDILIELQSTRTENQELNTDLTEANMENKILKEKIGEIRTKYKNKKNENEILREKCLGFTNEIARLESMNREALNYNSKQENNENVKKKKMQVRKKKLLTKIYKAINDLKGIIGEYRDRSNFGYF